MPSPMPAWTDDEIRADGAESYHLNGDQPGLNPFVAGRGDPRRAKIWHAGFAEARAQKRAAQVRTPLLRAPFQRRHP